MMRRLCITLTDPSGVEMDLTARVAAGRMGPLTEGSEETVLEQSHGDISFAVADQDGAVERFLAQASPATIYQITIDRETGRRRPLWERLFGGTLDLPWSLTYDRDRKTVGFQAFAFTKILERGSADGVKRDVVDREATVSIVGSNDDIVTTDTTDIVPGDRIKLSVGTVSEEKVVKSIDSPTQLTVMDDFQNNYPPGALTLLTPYLRNKTVAYLAELVFEAAGVTNPVIEASQPISTYPIATELSTTGLPLPTISVPNSIVQQTGLITITYPSGTPKRRTSGSPYSDFIEGATSNLVQADWSPYLLAEPGTIRANVGAFWDRGLEAWDYAGGHLYMLVSTYEDELPDTSRLDLYKDGVVVTVVDEYTDAFHQGYRASYLEYDPINNIVWLSFWTFETSQRKATLYWDPIAGVGLPHGVDAKCGGLRMVRAHSTMLQTLTDGTVRLLDLTAKTVLRSVSGQPTDMLPWTARALGNHLCILYRKDGQGRLRIYDVGSLGQVADYEIVKEVTSFSHGLLAIFDPSGLNPVIVGFFENRYFVLARTFAGIIPYADFSGQSCAAALRDLAVASMTLVVMDEYRNGGLRFRGFIDPMRPDSALGVPLSQVTRHIWEFYRTSVEIKGRTEAGEDIAELAGDRGDSAHRLSIEARLVTTHSLAQFLGVAYLGFLFQPRVQEDIQEEEVAERELPRFFDTATLNGRRHYVLKVERDLERSHAKLQLASLVAGEA